MRRKKEWEIKNIVRQEIQAENLRIATKEQDEEQDGFEDLRCVTKALTYFIERVSYSKGREKNCLSDAAYAVLPEAAKVLKEITEIIHIQKGGVNDVKTS